MSIQTRYYPEPCRENMETIMNNVKTDAQTTYAMILMTATLMDLQPSDPKVAEIIMDDCKGLRVVHRDE